MPANALREYLDTPITSQVLATEQSVRDVVDALGSMQGELGQQLAADESVQQVAAGVNTLVRSRTIAPVITPILGMAAPGAATNIFGQNLQPKGDGNIWRITVALATASVFNVIITGRQSVQNGPPSGQVTKTEALNSGGQLFAASLFSFNLPVYTAFQYNFQVVTNGVIDYLSIEEVSGPVI